METSFAVCVCMASCTELAAAGWSQATKAGIYLQQVGTRLRHFADVHAIVVVLKANVERNLERVAACGELHGLATWRKVRVARLDELAYSAVDLLQDGGRDSDVDQELHRRIARQLSALKDGRRSLSPTALKAP